MIIDNGGKNQTNCELPSKTMLIPFYVLTCNKIIYPIPNRPGFALKADTVFNLIKIRLSLYVTIFYEIRMDKVNNP